MFKFYFPPIPFCLSPKFLQNPLILYIIVRQLLSHILGQFNSIPTYLITFEQPLLGINITIAQIQRPRYISTQINRLPTKSSISINTPRTQLLVIFYRLSRTCVVPMSGIFYRAVVDHDTAIREL